MPPSAPVKGVFLGWFPMSLLVRAAHPVFNNTDNGEQRRYPLLTPGQFKSIESWPRYCRPYLSGPVHIIEDYGVAARLTEIAAPNGQKALRFRMMLYSLDRRSLSPAALMLRGMFQDRIRALGHELSDVG